MKKITLREFNEEMNRVGGFRECMRDLEEWTDDEIWDRLPDQDARYAEGEEGLGSLLNDILYGEEK